MSEKITPFRRGAKWTDPDTLDTLNRLIAAANTTGELTGDGTITVSRSPAGGRSVGISVAKLIPQIPKPLPIRWGKATATWTTGNTVVLDPCDVAGNDIPYESNVTGYVISPMADSPDSSIDPEITIGDVLAYLPFWSADAPPLPCGVLINPKLVVDADSTSSGQAGYTKHLDLWLRCTQQTWPVYTVLSADDWRGRIVEGCITSYFGGTVADANAGFWSPEYGGGSNGWRKVGLTWTHISNDADVTVADDGNASISIWIDKTDGHLKATCDLFLFETQYRLIIRATAVKTAPDVTF